MANRKLLSFPQSQKLFMLLAKLKCLINICLHTNRPKNSDGKKFRLITSYKTRLCIPSLFRKNGVDLTIIFVHFRKFIIDFLIYKSGNVQTITNQRNNSC